MVDIKQMYNQVKVRIYDMDALRFLWRVNSWDVSACVSKGRLTILFLLCFASGSSKKRHNIERYNKSYFLYG